MSNHFYESSKQKTGSPTINQLKKAKHRTLRKISSKNFSTFSGTNNRRRTSSDTTLKSQQKSKQGF